MTQSAHPNTTPALGPTDGQNTAGPVADSSDINKSSSLFPTLEDARKNLGAKIRAARELQDLTAEQLAHDSASSPPEILQIEAGELDATLCTLLRIAQRLGITVEDLFEGI